MKAWLSVIVGRLPNKCNLQFINRQTSLLGKGVYQQMDIAAHRVHDGTGGAMLELFLHLAARLVGRARCGDAVDQILGHQVLGSPYLLMGGGPTPNGLHLCHHLHRDARSLGK